MIVTSRVAGTSCGWGGEDGGDVKAGERGFGSESGVERMKKEWKTNNRVLEDA